MAEGVFMALLDIQVVASSLQEIQAGLSATRDEIAWVQTSYLIAEVIIIPLSGWLVRVLSTPYLFVFSCAGFTLTSLGSAVDDRIPSLAGISGRCDDSHRLYSNLYHLPPTTAAGDNHCIGIDCQHGAHDWARIGWLSDRDLQSGSVVPDQYPARDPGVFSGLALCRHRSAGMGLLQKIDFIGIALIAVCLGCMQFVLEEGVRKQWFEDHLIVTLTIIAIVSGLAMFIWELKNAHPIIDLYAFRNINFAVDCWYSFVLGVGLYTII